ncbi:MAG: hypothetical protein MHPSP_000519, partial [Paramarteilia canceri]
MQNSGNRGVVVGAASGQDEERRRDRTAQRGRMHPSQQTTQQESYYRQQQILYSDQSKPQSSQWQQINSANVSGINKRHNLKNYHPNGQYKKYHKHVINNSYMNNKSPNDIFLINPQTQRHPNSQQYYAYQQMAMSHFPAINKVEVQNLEISQANSGKIINKTDVENPETLEFRSFLNDVIKTEIKNEKSTINIDDVEDEMLKIGRKVQSSDIKDNKTVDSNQSEEDVGKVIFTTLKNLKIKPSEKPLDSENKLSTSSELFKSRTKSKVIEKPLVDSTVPNIEEKPKIDTVKPSFVEKQYSNQSYSQKADKNQRNIETPKEEFTGFRFINSKSKNLNFDSRKKVSTSVPESIPVTKPTIVSHSTNVYDQRISKPIKNDHKSTYQATADYDVPLSSLVNSYNQSSSIVSTNSEASQISIEPKPKIENFKKQITNSYSIDEFMKYVTEIPVKECYERLPIIFRRIGSKTITLSKIDLLSTDDIGFNPKAAVTDDDKILKSVRLELNKLSKDNFNEIQNNLIRILKKLDNDNLVRKISEIFFSKAISMSDSVYLYATILKKCAENITLATFVYLIKEYIDETISSDPYTSEKVLDLKNQMKGLKGIERENIEDFYLTTLNRLKRNYQNNLLLMNYLFVFSQLDTEYILSQLDHLWNYKTEFHQIQFPMIFTKLLPKLLQNRIAVSKIDNFIANMRQISENPNTPLRLRFAIEDCLEAHKIEVSKANPSNRNFSQSHNFKPIRSERLGPETSKPYTAKKTNVDPNIFSLGSSGSHKDNKLSHNIKSVDKKFDDLDDVYEKLKKTIKSGNIKLNDAVDSISLKPESFEELSLLILEYAADQKDIEICKHVAKMLAQIILHKKLFLLFATIVE